METQFILFSFLGRSGKKQVQQMSAETSPPRKVCSGGRVHGDMHEAAEVEKQNKGTFFQVCFSLLSLPGAESFFELVDLFLKSTGLCKNNSGARKARRESFFLFFSSFKNFTGNYSKSSLYPPPFPLYPLVSLGSTLHPHPGPSLQTNSTLNE